jgi:hypothetical protein
MENWVKRDVERTKTDDVENEKNWAEEEKTDSEDTREEENVAEEAEEKDWTEQDDVMVKGEQTDRTDVEENVKDDVDAERAEMKTQEAEIIGSWQTADTDDEELVKMAAELLLTELVLWKVRAEENESVLESKADKESVDWVKQDALKMPQVRATAEELVEKVKEEKAENDRELIIEVKTESTDEVDDSKDVKVASEQDTTRVGIWQRVDTLADEATDDWKAETDDTMEQPNGDKIYCCCSQETPRMTHSTGRGCKRPI